MSQFKIHTIESAPEAAQEALKAVQNANGFIPNLIGVLANAPTALETYRYPQSSTRSYLPFRWR